MNQFKRAKVVMLSTENKSSLHLNKITKKLHKYPSDSTSSKSCIQQNIYITSDDEIKEGDWKYNSKMNCITQHLREGKNLPNELLQAATWCKKIIATTDTSLNTDNRTYIYAQSERTHLPQLSQQFIEKYIESYNKDEIITDVLVEYEVDKITMVCTCKDNSIGCSFAYYDGVDECCKKRFPDGKYWNRTFKLKVNPKDNTITIKKLKDSWSRKEVIELLNKLNNTLNIGSDLTLEQWIQEKL